MKLITSGKWKSSVRNNLCINYPITNRYFILVYNQLTTRVEPPGVKTVMVCNQIQEETG